MSKPSDNPADAFKKALAEATKVMSHDPDLTVSYSVDPSGLSGDAMRLPQVSRRMTRDEVLLARGTADALALNRRYHNGQTHSKYLPNGDMARELYEAMETARCEAVGARDMPGTAGNIDAKIKHDALPDTLCAIWPRAAICPPVHPRRWNCGAAISKTRPVARSKP